MLDRTVIAILRRAILLLTFACAWALPISPAKADSWGPLRRAVYTSANGDWRLVVTPAAPGDPPVGRGPSEGRLERRGPGRRWTVQWRRPLVNELAPASALVSDDGRYAVTFDNWYSLGTGDNVVVIYGAAGGLVRSLRLTDFLAEHYVRALPRSFSSRWWGGDHRFAADRLVLEVAFPSETLFEGPGPIPLELALATGQPSPPAGPDWQRALAEAARIRVVQRERAAAALRHMTEPLLGPSGGSRDQWEGYLTDAFYRLDPGWRDVHPVAHALPAPGTPRYEIYSGFVAGSVRSRPRAEIALLFGSPDEEDLIRVLAETFGRVRSGSWRGTKVYVAAHDANWPRIAALFAPSGAEPVQLDPTEPIPQRPERLRDYIERTQTP